MEQQQYSEEEEEYDEEDLLQAIEEAENDETLAFDHDSLVKLINQFEKHVIKNGQLRSQFADKPDKFMESEIELDEDIKKFYHLTAYPELIPIFNKSPSAIKNIAGLLSHENNDIRVEVIGFIKDFVSMEFDKPEEQERYQQEIVYGVQKFIQYSVLEGLYQNLQKCDEIKQDESETAFKILEIFENILDLDSEFIQIIGDKINIIKWILARLLQNIKHKVIDDNKLYVSELLPILISHPKNQLLFNKSKGIDALIEFLSKYKSTDPTSEEEKEMIMNIFDSLSIVLIQRDFQDEFRAKLGIDLMLKMIKEKKFCAKPALKIIMFALLNNGISCQYFIDAQGLKYVTPILLMKGIKSKKESEQKNINEQIFSIVKSLLKETKGLVQERVVNKFRENSFEKIDRLFELHNYYYGFINEIDRRMQNPAYQHKLLEDGFSKEEIKENIFLKKQEIGLNILESIDFIILFLYNWKDEDIQDRIQKTLSMHENTAKQVKNTINEHIEHLDEEEGNEDIVSLNMMLRKFK